MNEQAIKTHSPAKTAAKNSLLTKFLMAILVLCCVLSYSLNSVLNVLYKICISAEAIVLVVCVAKCRLSKVYQAILWICFAMILMRAVSIRPDSINYNLSAIVQMVIIAAVLFANDRLTIDESTVKFYNKILFVVCILGIIDYFLSADKISFVIFGTMNTFAGVFLFLLVIEWLLTRYYFKKNYVVNMVICLLLILASDSRTPLLALCWFIINLFLLKKIFKTEAAKKVLFFLFVIGIIVFICFYINIENWAGYRYFNDLSNKYFHKNIDSGRPGIWAKVLGRIKNNWLFGVGYVMSVTDYSGHNQFIQLLGDNGVVGIVLLIALFAVIWFEFAKHSDDKIVRTCMAMLLAFIVYNCFEVTLLQNKFALGCLQWLIISIGLGRCGKLRREKTME